MQKRSEETRKRILTSAAQLFSENGYDRTGVDQICSTAGISKGAFYHHFPEKNTVFVVLMEEWINNIQNRMKDVLSKSENVPSGLVSIAGSLDEYLGKNNSRLPIFLEFWHYSIHDPELWKQAISPYFEYQKFFHTIIDQGMAENSLSVVESSVLSRILLSFSLGLILSNMIDPAGCDWDYIAKSGIATILGNNKVE